MITTRLSAKGQLVLPAALRKARAWVPGTRFEVLATPEGVLLKPLAAAPAFAPTTLDAVFGMARYTGPTRTLEEMNADVAAEAARRRSGCCRRGLRTRPGLWRCTASRAVG